MSHMALSLPPELSRDIGWALIHFLWQGCILAGLLYLALPMCRSAASRHNLALGTLVTMGLAPIVTFVILHNDGPSGAALVAAPGLSLQATVAGGGAAVPALQPDLLAWIVTLWVIGVAALSLRAAGGWWLAETWRRVDTDPLPAELRERCRALQQRLAPTRAIRFLQSRRVSVPVVVGWFKPVVLIPVSAVTGLPAEQLDALILHELAHIVRLDAFTNGVQVAVETILFYHPAVWWVSRLVRAEREHCCDDVAVSACGDVSTYVEALISLESARLSPKFGLAASGGKLKDRVMRLLDKPANSRRFPSSALAGLALLALVFGSVATAQNPPVAHGHQTLSIRVVDQVPAGNLNQVPAGDDRVAVAKAGAYAPRELLLKREGEITGDVVTEAHIAKGENGQPIIKLTLTPEAAAKFAELTRENVGRQLAVVVNGRIVMAPVVRDPILGGSLEIDGHYATDAEARAAIDQMMGTNR